MLNYKRLSEEYMPSEIRLLLVGEAPPDGGTRFFYNVPEKKYDFLFKAVYSAINEEDENKYESLNCPGEMKEGILATLQYKGVFITDLSPVPLDLLPDGVTSISYAEDFIERLKKLPLADDCKIVIFKGGTTIQPLLEQFGYKSEILSLSRDTGSRGIFISGFRDLYKNLKKRK